MEKAKADEIDLGLDESSETGEDNETDSDSDELPGEREPNPGYVDLGAEEPAETPEAVDVELDLDESSETGEDNGESGQTSERKREANRKNAQLSTGPRTERGKNFSRLNSLKHGLLARTIPVENLPYSDIRETEELDVLLSDFYSELQPEGKVEEHLVERIACIFLQFSRVYRFQRAGVSIAFNKDWYTPTLEVVRWRNEVRRARLERLLLLDEAAIGKIVRYESMLDREFHRCLDRLDRLQQRRRKNGSSGAKPADASSPGDGPTRDKTGLLDS